MIIEIESVDNIVESIDEIVNITVDENLTSIIEIDDDSLEITVSDAESDLSLQIVEESVCIEPIEEVVSIIEIENQPGTGGGDNPFRKINFSFDSISPLNLINMLTGDCIDKAEVTITQAFDDPAATLSIGTALNSEEILAEEDIEPDKECTYHTGDNYVSTSAESIRLYINPGASTQGAGFVITTKF